MISSSFIPFKYSLAQKVYIFFGPLFWTSFLWPTSLLLPEEFLVTFLIGYVCWQIPQFIVIWVSVYFCFSFKWYFYKIFSKILMDFFSFSTFEQFYSFLLLYVVSAQSLLNSYLCSFVFKKYISVVTSFYPSGYFQYFLCFSAF